ncbi:hypothetical protein HY495_03770 [Candidatus Woesearchaeota archaeon]|nr:hypothetical protein [Candidatus Woesearchaeota archaeon]
MDVIVDGQKRKINWTKISLAVAVIVAVVLFIRPGILGYGVYLEAKNSNYSIDELGQNLQALQFKLDSAEQNLSVQDSLNDKVVDLIERSNSNLLACESERAKLQAESTYAAQLCAQRTEILRQELADNSAALANQTSAELQRAQEDLAVVQDQLDKTVGNFNMFAENTARSVCCKQKYDNAEINSYNIINNKLVCLGSGGSPLNCTLG